jgi:hypothetical protein
MKTDWELTVPPTLAALKLTGFGEATKPFVLPPVPTLRFTWKLVWPYGVFTVTVPV